MLGVEDGLPISAVARQGGLRPSAIRYYESIGLLPPPRRVNGRRRYEPDVLKNLAVIRLAQQAGFTIAEIRTLFRGFAPDTPASARWRSLAEQKLPEVEARIVRATAIWDALAALLRCECRTFADCVGPDDADYSAIAPPPPREARSP